jgi:hypothetical protein
MKWILAILCGLALQAGAITNGVFATKDPYVVESATMPFDLWLQTKLAISADFPVLNAGTTNAQWICYAKTCSGNAFQLDPNKQPLRVLTNGFWGLGFDGSDDFLVANRPADFVHRTGKFRISLMVFIKDVTRFQRIMNNCVGSSVQHGFGVDNFSSTARFWMVNGVSGTTTVLVSRPTTNGWNICTAVGSGTNVVLTINGSSITGAYANAVSTNASPDLLGIGRVGSSAETGGLLDGFINFVQISENP